MGCGTLQPLVMGLNGEARGMGGRSRGSTSRAEVAASTALDSRGGVCPHCLPLSKSRRRKGVGEGSRVLPGDKASSLFPHLSLSLSALPMRTAVLLWVLVSAHCSLSLRICSFNVRAFGRAKAAKQRVMETLVEIVSRCDICLMMEVRDSKGQAVPRFISQLNRVDKVKVLDVHQYRDGGPGYRSVFARGPSVVHFSAPDTEVKEFALIPQHTCPDAAVREVDELYNVSQYIRELWGTENIMILGDLNAGCSYIPPSAWSRIRLRTEPGFHWLIGDSEDTTVCESTSCPYDRIIVYGAAFHRAIEPGSAKVFDFRRSFRLSEEEALEVSDHFPVEVQVKEVQRPRAEL
ncbi:deoxyribonuclease gamma-like isoform X2 [Pristis pectinata]|uniref:deoxyribonuclease gamma-like isoform X2 n=1 Tax=Pristis pectinata TaxID=685728 RepID=UPI00223DD607|nr:deoxyribonuclease gamma-like isoform X2 [Pristis pectinata]